MAEEAAKKVEVEVAKEPEAAPAAAEAPKEDVAEEKAVIPASEPPAAEEKPADDSKALAIVESEYYLLCFRFRFFFLCTGRLEVEIKRWWWCTGLCCWEFGRNFAPFFLK
jgi:hypothetical protein